MKKYDLSNAADRVLSNLESMSDEELISALEQCDTSLAYAVDYFSGKDVYSFSETNLSLFSRDVFVRSLYSSVSKDVTGKLDPLCLIEAMNDSYYTLAA